MIINEIAHAHHASPHPSGPNGISPLRPTPPRRARDSPGDARGRRAVRQRLELGGPSAPSAPSRGPPLVSAPAMAVQLGLVGTVGGLLGSALRDGRQSGARPKVMRSNAGHNCATMWQVLSHMPYNQTKACRVAVIL